MHASRTLTIVLVVAAVAPSLGALGQRRQLGDDSPDEPLPGTPATPSPTLSPTQRRQLGDDSPDNLPDTPATPSPTLSPTMSPSVSPTVYCFRDDLERKLQRILFALHNFHDVHRHFPPERFGATGPADLTQSLSWRVYILPFLGYDALYSNFVLDEPWDSPANQAAAAMGMPDEFRILGQALTDTTTRFLAPVGSIGAGNFDAILDSTVAEGSKLRDVMDGASNTIMLGVSSAGAAVEWASPDDVTFANHPTVGDASGFAATVDYTPVVMADGAVQWLRHNALSAATFEALVSRNGGEVVDGNAPGLGETPNCDGLAPTPSPTVSPTVSPTTTAPTLEPTTTPTESPTTSAPTVSPTVSPSTSSPTVSPTTSSPTESPTASPTTTAPTVSPTASPSTSSPTVSPTTSSPTASPNPAPTDQCVRRGHWCHDDECCEGNVCRRHWLLWWHKKCLPCKRRGSKCGSRNECCSGRSRRFGWRLRCE